MNYERIILDLINRVSLLEEKVRELQSLSVHNTDNRDSSSRDTTKYILDGNLYCKNKLVLSIVKKYRDMNPNISAEELIRIFNKSLQGSFGVVRKIDDVKNRYSDYKRRFFCKRNEVINTTTSDCVVCTQWGINNINNVIARAKDLGINVTII